MTRRVGLKGKKAFEVATASRKNSGFTITDLNLGLKAEISDITSMTPKGISSLRKYLLAAWSEGVNLKQLAELKLLYFLLGQLLGRTNR